MPVLITAKLQGKLLTGDTLRLLGMAILAQSGGNLINSYFDYTKKIDTKEEAGDASIVAGHIAPQAALPVALLCIGGSAAVILDFIRKVPGFGSVFALGTAISVFYTAPPFSLKYHKLGDLCILASFGPVLMQACSLAFTGATDLSLNTYGIPVTVLTEAILWANNARDIQADSRAGASTMCTALGFDKSKKVYKGMVVFAYLVCAALAAQRRKPGLVLPLLTLPLAAKVFEQFKEGKSEMLEAPDRSAQLHVPFGLATVVGLALDEKFFS